MGPQRRTLTGKERTFPEDELIVSKTDKSGRITYVNDVFITVSGYLEAEAVGKPHSLVRHPDTPRCLFKLMWDKLHAGEEIFVYLNNRAKNGDHYWVFAHVTPDIGPDGGIVGYHSNRRLPRRAVIEKLQPLYDRLRAGESAHDDSRQGLDAATRLLNEFLTSERKSYDEFVFDL